MRHLFYFLFISGTLFAQIPVDYYNSADGLTGYQLKTQLKNIISTGVTTRSYNDLLTLYATSNVDSYYENDGTLLDIYSERPNATDQYSYVIGQDECGNTAAEGTCYNREHVIPASVFGDASPMYSDAHSVWPVDGYINNRRGRLPFGETSSASLSFSNGSAIGSSNIPGFSGDVFEPIDEFKGDVARIFFYFVTRYEDNVAGYGGYSMFNGTSDQALEDWILPVLINWHNNDPVSQFERDRNETVYNYQGNANPFISRPEFVNQIWTSSVDSEAPSVPTNLMSSNISATSFTLSWDASTDNNMVSGYNVYIDGSLYGSTSSTQLNITGLSPTTQYNATVSARDGAGNESAESSVLAVTTTDATVANQLMITEYVEGSGLNKAVEISNFTNSPVNLLGYELRLFANGATSPTGTYQFPDMTLNHGESVVVANTNLNCVTNSFILNNSVTSFNGNDPIGLYFTGNQLIDLIGTIGDTTEFAAEVTLRRKSEILNPTQVYQPSQWDTLGRDVCDGLGTHSVLSTSEVDNLINETKVYPNPNQGNFQIKLPAGIDSAEVEIYSVNGQRVKSISITANNNEIQGLSIGIYLVNIKTNKGSISKKLIVN